MRDPLYLTRACADRLRRDLAALEAARTGLSKAIGVAREHGDLSENAEYDTAREALELNELRSAQLRGKLAHVEIIEDLDLPDDRIYVGAAARVRNCDTGAERTITLLSAEESDPDKDIISYQSPVGKGLLGHAVGDIAEIETPGGVLRFEIVAITR